MKTLLFNCIVFLFSTIYVTAQITAEPEPKWTKEIAYSVNDIDIKNASSGTYLLLHDNQIEVQQESQYQRNVIKITDNVGIQSASTIKVDYDPSYQKLKFHKIQIIREGKIIDKLNVSNFQELRREMNAENFLYDGSLSAVMNISDVRTNDIIDYSYSIIGFNPIHNNIFSGVYYLNDLEEVGAINLNIISKNELKYKLLNNAAKPMTTKNPETYEYNWLVKKPKKLDYEDGNPLWNISYDTVNISEYESWESVVDWAINVYKVKGNLSPELQKKIKEINTHFQSNGDKIKATLDFVQNEIRYLGLESGIGSYKPFSPNQVYDQRFGDCKDKSLLMVTMLNHMGIEAYPVLVNTYLKHTIKDLLPSPTLFDHCVVRVESEFGGYWYDPTATNQGGDFDSTHFPDYRYALVIKEGNYEFDKINPYSENKVETFEEFTIDTIGRGAKLKVITTYYEAEADFIRNYFKNNSINTIKKEFENFYSNYYFNVSSTKEPTFKDKKYGNVFKVYEEYQIDSIWVPVPENKDNIGVNFSPSSMSNLLYVPTKTSRSSEISVVFPILREHRTRINLPIHWNIENEKIFLNSPAFYYEWNVNYDRKKQAIDLYYYIKTQKDHVSLSEYSQYVKDVTKLSQTIGYHLYLPKNYESISSGQNGDFIYAGVAALIKTLLVFAVIIALILLGFWLLRKLKRSI